MTRALALLVTLFPAVTLTLAEDQSRPNKSEESNSFNVELPILKQKLSGDPSAPEAPDDAAADHDGRADHPFCQNFHRGSSIVEEHWMSSGRNSWRSR